MRCGGKEAAVGEQWCGAAAEAEQGEAGEGSRAMRVGCGAIRGMAVFVAKFQEMFPWEMRPNQWVQL
jgi:hypothetical protein